MPEPSSTFFAESEDVHGKATFGRDTNAAAKIPRSLMLIQREYFTRNGQEPGNIHP